MISALETNVNIASWLSELQKNHLHYAYTAVYWMITFIFFPWKNHVFCDIRLKLSSVNFWDTLSLFRLHLIWRDPKSNYCIYGIGCWPVYIAIPFYKKITSCPYSWHLLFLLKYFRLCIHVRTVGARNIPRVARKCVTRHHIIENGKSSCWDGPQGVSTQTIFGQGVAGENTFILSSSLHL